MRAVTTATAAAVLGIDRKSLDNLLARVGPELSSNGRQGVERRIPVSLLEDVALAIELSEHLTIPSREAFRLAGLLLGRDTMGSAERSAGGVEGADTRFIGSLALGPFIQLGVDLQALRRELRARLEQAIEMHVRPRRGRPRRARAPAGPRNK